jgi:hypothetical protein
VATRKAISKRTRFEVFKRDAFTCQYCGAHPPQVILHVDHIVAVANGGRDDMDNLVTSCQPCNLGKSAKPLSSVPKSLKEKAAEVAEREEQLRGYHEVIESSRERVEDEMWRVAEEFRPGCSKEGLSRSYLQSIKMFLAKLDFYEVLDAMELTMSKTHIYSDSARFRYFCAVCWNKIKGEGNGQDSDD